MATLKQKRAFKTTLENLGASDPQSMGEILLEAGYAPAVAHTPTIVTESKGWQELLDEHLPEKDLVRVAKEGLSASRGNEPDHAIRHRYLETGLKLHGKLMPSEDRRPTTNIFVGQLTIEQQRRLAGEVLRITESGAGQPNSVPDSDQS